MALAVEFDVAVGGGPFMSDLMSFEIKAIMPAHLAELREMVERTFLESLAHLNTAEDMAIYGKVRAI